MRANPTRRLAALGLACAASAALIVPTQAPGAGTLNSTCAPPGGGFIIVSYGGKAAQSFPANAGGKLLTVDILQLARFASETDAAVLVEVFGTDGTGTPVAPLLSSTTIPGASINDDGFFHDYSVNFDPAGAAYLSPGQSYAVAISTTDAVQNSWNFSEGNPCANVALFSGGPPFGHPPYGGSESWDAGLRTYLGPPNDDFSRAEQLSGQNASPNGTTAGGTREDPDEPDHYTIGPGGDPALWNGGHSVWYRWTAPNSGPTEIDTCTSTIDSILAVYTGSALNALTRVTDNNNDAACSEANIYGSKVSFTAVGGTEYYIAVGDAGGATQNTFTLSIKGSPDITAPRTKLDSGPEGLTNDPSPSFAFSSEPGATFECRLDSNAEEDFAPCTSPKSYGALADGPHTFEVRATDSAANTESPPVSRNWTVDTSRPDTGIDAGPSGTIDAPSATFSFSSSEPGATFKCRLDSASGGEFADCASPATHEALADGSHTFEVVAIDRAGNQDESPASRSFTVAVPPETAIVKAKIRGKKRRATFRFSSTEPGSTFLCKLDRKPFRSCPSPKTYKRLKPGKHRFQVQALDPAGNLDSTPATRSFRIKKPRR
jgi:hypothetical protein